MTNVFGQINKFIKRRLNVIKIEIKIELDDRKIEGNF